MVKKYGDLYLECRRALMQTEDAQTAGLMARNLVAYYSGKRQEEVLRDRDLYAGEATCNSVESATERLLRGEPLPYVLGEWEFYGLRLLFNRGNIFAFFFSFCLCNQQECHLQKEHNPLF